MTRTTAPCPGGRIVTYTSDDGLYCATSQPSALPTYYRVDWWQGPGSGQHHGVFRSESEACDQARSRVRYYELEQRAPSRPAGEAH